MRSLNSWMCSGLALAVIAAVVNSSPPLHADDEPADTAVRSIDQWIHALGDRDFAARREAERELISRGAEVVDAVAEAASKGPRETTLRCLEILSRLKRGDDESASEAAEQALQRLAESEDGSLAERARSLIEELPNPNEILGNQRRRGIPQIQLQVVQARAFDANGRRSIDVEQDGKSVHIEETRGEGIVVQITETVDGEEQTREVKAENVAELRRKDDEAFRLYRDHMQRGGAGAIAINGQLLPQQVANRRVSVTEANGERVVRVEEDGREIEIRSRDDKDIRMEVTEEVDGKEETTEYEADTLEELREQHPKAAELYDEFNRQGGGIQVQAIFNAVGGGLRFQAPPQRGRVPNDENDDGEARNLIDDSIEELKEIREGLQQRGDNADEQSLDELVRRLEEAEEQLREARAKLGE